MANSTTKQTEITDDEKEIVLKRQNYHSISGVYLGTDIHNCDFHHVVNSGLGIKGVGYEWNLVALSRNEHRLLHDHQNIGRYSYLDFIIICKNHLKLRYANWNEDKCKVKKGYSKDDYGVKYAGNLARN